MVSSVDAFAGGEEPRALTSEPTLTAAHRETITARSSTPVVPVVMLGTGGGLDGRAGTHVTHSPSRGRPASSQSVSPPEYRRTCR
jgi:hypothetical protein